MSYVDVDLGAVDRDSIRTKYVHEGQLLLVKTLEAARKFRETFPSEVARAAVSDPRVAASLLVPFLNIATVARIADARAAAQEAADVIYSTTEAQVVRLLTVGSDGVFAWERNPSLLTSPMDFLRGESASLRATARSSEAIDALSKTLEALARVASTLARGVTEVAVNVVRESAEEIARQLQKTSGGGMLVLGAAAVGLVALFLILDD